MSNSDPTEPKSNTRPHRRLSLTRPSEPISSPLADSTDLPVAEGEVALDVANSPVAEGEIAPDASATVRVMAYLSGDEARVLDETWLRLRSHPSRPSKSDILRAACALASQDFDQLARILLEQQSSTLSRQRSSKVRKSAP